MQGTKVELVRIPRDRAEGERLYKLARSFWDEFVVKGVEPPFEEPTKKAKAKEMQKNHAEQLFNAQNLVVQWKKVES